MTRKTQTIGGLLLASMFLVACQPPQDEPESLLLEEAPATDESIMLEGTDQPIPEEVLLFQDDEPTEDSAFPTASPTTTDDQQTEPAL